jgi:hypothetical protein
VPGSPIAGISTIIGGHFSAPRRHRQADGVILEFGCLARTETGNMANRMYGYLIQRERARSGRNRVSEARDPCDGSSLVIFEWTPPAKSWLRALEVAAGLQTDLERTGVSVFSTPGRICLAVKRAELAVPALEKLQSPAVALFTGHWPGMEEPITGPPLPLPSAGRPNWGRRFFVLIALAGAGVSGFLTLRLRSGSASSGAPTRVDFFASPNSIDEGKTITLSWNAPGSSRLELWANGALLPTAPLQAPTGRMKHSPQLDTIYEIHALGADGVWVRSEQRKVTVRLRKSGNGEGPAAGTDPDKER